MNATGTSTSQRSTNAIAGTRKRPFDAGTTPSTVPAKKKQATRSLNAGTTPSTAPAKKKQATRSSNAGTTDPQLHLQREAMLLQQWQNRRLRKLVLLSSKEAKEKWKYKHSDFCLFYTLLSYVKLVSFEFNISVLLISFQYFGLRLP
ncbi:hypothetical protein Tco_0534361 [Tanacetum coccineum]